MNIASSKLLPACKEINRQSLCWTSLRGTYNPIRNENSKTLTRLLRSQATG